MSHSCESSGNNSESFRHEFDSALADAISILSMLTDNPDGFIEAHTVLDRKLAGIIEKWKPPRVEREEARESAVAALKEFIAKSGVDVVPCEEPDIRRLCISIMNASGGYHDAIPRVDRIVEDTLIHLEHHGFSAKEAQELIRCLMGFETTDMRKMLDSISSENSIIHADFLRFMQKNGHGQIATRASNILENMLSVQSTPKPDAPGKSATILQFARNR
jgi:hypothetical protein